MPGVEIEGVNKTFGEDREDTEVDFAERPYVWPGERERYEVESGREEYVDEVDDGTERASGCVAVRFVCDGFREGTGRWDALLKAVARLGVARACLYQH